MTPCAPAEPLAVGAQQSFGPRTLRALRLLQRTEDTAWLIDSAKRGKLRELLHNLWSAEDADAIEAARAAGDSSLAAIVMASAGAFARTQPCRATGAEGYDPALDD